MSYKWRQLEEGIRIREHHTRKHGVKPDAYFVIRYQIDGRRQEEALGWASKGMTLSRARLELAKLKESARTGMGETSLRDKRKAAVLAREAAERAQRVTDNAVNRRGILTRHVHPKVTHPRGCYLRARGRIFLRGGEERRSGASLPPPLASHSCPACCERRRCRRRLSLPVSIISQ